MLDNLAPMAQGAAGSENDRAPGAPPPSVLLGGPGDDESPPRTVGDAGTWLFLAAGGFVGGQVLSTVILIVVAAVNGHSAELSKLAAQAVPPAWIVIGGLVGLWIGFVGAVVLASRTRGTGSVVADMGLRFQWWDPLVGIAVGLAGQYLLITVLYLPWEHFDRNLSHELAQPAKHLTGGFPGVDLAVIAVLTVLVVPVVEELFFRGLVLRGFLRIFAGAGRILGPALSVTATGIVFGLAHAELLELLGLAAFGIVLSVMAYRFRRLGPGIFAHAAFNLVAILGIAYQSGAVHWTPLP
jgi:membrane protease YdiL (CAAX protease family)